MEFVSQMTGAHPWPYLRYDIKDISLIGKSDAGIETIISIPQWNISFDTGRAPSFAIHLDYLALSHWHLDHSGGLLHYLGLRCLNNLKPLIIFIPPQTFKMATEFLMKVQEISQSQLFYELVPLKEASPLNPRLLIEPLSSTHCIESQGYLVSEKKRKLKKKYLKATSKEIINQKNEGHQIDEEIHVPKLSFSGDTTGAFLQTPAVKAEVFIMECSFFGEDEDKEKIQTYGHTHIHDWKKHADLIESPHPVMIHTSQRYSIEEIEKSCKKNLPKSLLDRLIIFR